MLRVRRVFNSGTFRGSRRSLRRKRHGGSPWRAGREVYHLRDARVFFRAASAYVARRRAAASACLLRLAAVSLLNADLLDASGGTVTPGKSRRRNSRQTASVTGARSRPEPANVPDSTRSRTSGVSFAGRVGARGGSRRSRRGGAGGDARSGRELVRGRRRGRCVVVSGRRRCPRASARSPIAPDPPRASARARLILSAAIVVNPSWGRTDCRKFQARRGTSSASARVVRRLFTSRRPTESRERRLRATHAARPPRASPLDGVGEIFARDATRAAHALLLPGETTLIVGRLDVGPGGRKGRLRWASPDLSRRPPR